MAPRDQLPVVIAEIAEVAGLDAAWTLARAKGGINVFIPGKVRRGHWLAKLVGLEAAEKISAHYRVGSGEGRINGTWLLIPMAASAQAAQRWEEMLSSNLSITETARTMGVHQRTVSRRRTRHGWSRSGQQGNLFEGD